MYNSVKAKEGLGYCEQILVVIRCIWTVTSVGLAWFTSQIWLYNLWQDGLLVHMVWF